MLAKGVGSCCSEECTSIYCCACISRACTEAFEGRSGVFEQEAEVSGRAEAHRTVAR